VEGPTVEAVATVEAILVAVAAVAAAFALARGLELVAIFAVVEGTLTPVLEPMEEALEWALMETPVAYVVNAVEETLVAAVEVASAGNAVDDLVEEAGASTSDASTVPLVTAAGGMTFPASSAEDAFKTAVEEATAGEEAAAAVTTSATAA